MPQLMFLMLFRALNVFDEHGIPVSEIHEAQRSAVSQGLGELRFPNSCVLWVQSDQNGKTVWKATTIQSRLNGQIPKVKDQGHADFIFISVSLLQVSSFGVQKMGLI